MEARKKEIEAKRAEFDAKLKEILNEEQYAKFQEITKRGCPQGGPQCGTPEPQKEQGQPAPAPAPQKEQKQG